MNINKLLCFLFLSLISFQSSAVVVTESVSYRVDGQDFKGYLAYDNKYKTPRPGIIVVHEWWGHNDYSRKRARMLAEAGYSAISLDMYGDGKQASHPKDAGMFSKVLKENLDLAEKRFMAAYKLLQSQPQTDKKQIAAIGYCFGGGIVLAMARRGVELDGVVSFHGSLGEGAPAKTDAIKGRVLVLNGAADPFVKPQQIQAFKQEMTDAKVDFEFVNYPDAKHAFTNPEADAFGSQFKIPLAYNKQADEQSWKKMQMFFNEIFK
ncbi:MAG: dienelactone hydrolase family protein [Gammaproteobacteria bacterium]|nr:dienelactone hydrolase family protein [Gammaproteobacteria bacterium]